MGPISPPGPMWPQGPMGPGPIGPFAIIWPFGTMGPFMWPPLLPFMANVLSQCGGLWRTNCVVLSGCFCGGIKTHSLTSTLLRYLSSYTLDSLMDEYKKMSGGNNKTTRNRPLTSSSFLVPG